MRTGTPLAPTCASASARLRVWALALVLAGALVDAAALRAKLGCDAAWGTFRQEPLSRTVYNADIAPASSLLAFEPDLDIFKTFLHPESRFAFCPIEKNAHSVWNLILTRLFHGDPAAPLDYNVNVASWRRYAKQGFSSVFADPQATRAVFVRDPLARFVSSFLDKCIRQSTGGKPLLELCPMYKEGIVLRDAVEFALGTKFTDNHWKPQADFCDLYRTVGHYSVIGLVTADTDTTSRDSSCLLRKANLSQWDLWGREDIYDNRNSFGPRANMSEEDVLKRLFTPEAARALIARYRIDYDTFGFPAEPAWLEGAVGDWYEALPSAAPRMRKANVHHAWEDEDDIAVLAAETGYV